MATSHIIPPKSSTLPHSRSPASSASTSIAPTITPITCTPWHRQTLPVRCAGLVIHYHGQNGHSCVRHICICRSSGHDAVGMGRGTRVGPALSEILATHYGWEEEHPLPLSFFDCWANAEKKIHIMSCHASQFQKTPNANAQSKS